MKYLFSLLLILPTSLLAQGWEKLERCKLETDRYVNGDSFFVSHKGDTHNFRLYLCEVPDKTNKYPDRIEMQENIFGAEEKHLLEIGEEAAEFTEKTLRRSFTVYTQWEDAGGANDRYYAYLISRDGKDLTKELTSNGFSTAYQEQSEYFDGTSAGKLFREIKRLQQEARKKKVGIWEFSTLPQEAPLPPAPSDPVVLEGSIPATEIEAIKEMLGQTALISGEVSGVGQTPSGSITFINFEGSEFTAVVFADDREAIETELGTTIKEALKGRAITLQGEISTHRDIPQIKITDKAQINPEAKVVESE
ncbi:MAG: thermonuclease family protein [Roseibacillus sp.]